MLPFLIEAEDGRIGNKKAMSATPATASGRSEIRTTGECAETILPPPLFLFFGPYDVIGVRLALFCHEKRPVAHTSSDLAIGTGVGVARASARTRPRARDRCAARAST